jgi:hypothetical protein
MTRLGDIHGNANDLHEPIIKSFNLVGEEGFLASWTTNIIEMIFEYGEHCSLRNYGIIKYGLVDGWI